MHGSRVLVASCIFAVLAIAGIARAEPAPPEAVRLFQEGLALFDQGKFDEACTKFELSIAKDPRALGTLINLGRCNERRGKVATALKRYQEAFDRASEANATEARDKVQERIAALVSQVPVVTLRRAGVALAGEKLVVDDEVIASDKRELQLDPGTHTLVLTAPGRLPHQATFNVAIKDKLAVDLPELQLPKQATVVRASSRRFVGKLATFGGAGLALVGGGLMLYAKRDYDKQFEDPDGSGPMISHCDPVPAQPTCDAAGQSRTERANNLITLGEIVGVVGVVAAATGIALWVTAPKDERATIVPTGSTTGVGVAVIGRF